METITLTKTKNCWACKLTKNIDDFPNSTTRYDGKQTRCKQCRTKQQREREKTQPTAKYTRWCHSYLMRIKRSAANKNVYFDLKASDIRNLWDTQGGKCKLTGLDMLGPFDPKEDTASPNSASIDRIDYRIGYVVGNVRLICNCINMFRARMNDEDMLQMAEALISRMRS